MADDVSKREFLDRMEKMFDSSGRITVTGKWEIVKLFEQLSDQETELRSLRSSWLNLEKRAQVWEDYKEEHDNREARRVARVGTFRKLWK